MNDQYANESNSTLGATTARERSTIEFGMDQDRVQADMLQVLATRLAAAVTRLAGPYGNVTGEVSAKPTPPGNHLEALTRLNYMRTEAMSIIEEAVSRLDSTV